MLGGEAPTTFPRRPTGVGGTIGTFSSDAAEETVSISARPTGLPTAFFTQRVKRARSVSGRSDSPPKKQACCLTIHCQQGSRRVRPRRQDDPQQHSGGEGPSQFTGPSHSGHSGGDGPFGSWYADRTPSELPPRLSTRPMQIMLQINLLRRWRWSTTIQESLLMTKVTLHGGTSTPISLGLRRLLHHGFGAHVTRDQQPSLLLILLPQDILALTRLFPPRGNNFFMQSWRWANWIRYGRCFGHTLDRHGRGV